jgi:hypothetical protein
MKAILILAAALAYALAVSAYPARPAQPRNGRWENGD